jgi:hypothetical protein
MVDAVEEGLQVGVDDSVMAFFDIALRLPYCLMRIPVGPKAVAIGMEYALPLCLYDLRNGLLDEAVEHGRYP